MKRIMEFPELDDDLFELHDFVEKCEFILKASSEGRVDEKDTIEKICKNIIEIARQMKLKQIKAKEGYEAILAELNIIRSLTEDCKMDPRSLVADQHLIMEARVKDQIKYLDRK